MAASDDRQTAATDAALDAASVAEERQADLAEARRALSDVRRKGNRAEIRAAERKARAASARFVEASKDAEAAKGAMDDSFRESDLQRLKPKARAESPLILFAAAWFAPIINLIWAAALWRQGNRRDAAILVVPLPFLFAVAGAGDGAVQIALAALWLASPIIVWRVVKRRR